MVKPLPGGSTACDLDGGVDVTRPIGGWGISVGGVFSVPPKKIKNTTSRHSVSSQQGIQWSHC